MANHSSILAWRIPWTEEPGGAIARGATKSWTRACTGTPPPPVPTPAVYQCNLARPKLLATPRWSVGQGYARDLHGLGQ